MFSVIIPTFKRSKQLAKCLDCILLNNPEIEYEVIVTDDGDDTETKVMLEASYPWVFYVKGEQRGPAANRNNGAKSANGQWLVFTDDDCLPDPKWLSEYAEAIKKNPDIKAFEGAILPDDYNLLKKDLAECPVNLTGNVFWSANIMIEKALFQTIGGFNEDFSYAANEDQFLFELVKKHTMLVFVPECKVIHPVRILTLAEKIRLSKAKGNSWIQYQILQNRSLSWILCKAFSNSLRYLAASLIKGNCKEFIYHLFSLFMGIPAIPSAFNKLKTSTNLFETKQVS